MLGQHLQECVGHVDGALGVGLREPDVDVPSPALDLPADVHLAAQEVDVAELQGGGLAET